MSSDPFTLDVIQRALAAAAGEMLATFRKTAMSPIIYEVLDVGAGITDACSNLVSSGAGIPGLVGALDKTVKRRGRAASFLPRVISLRFAAR